MLNNQIQKFEFQSQGVRVVIIDGEPWWVLKDVCNALGLTNPTVVVSTLDDDERTKFNLGRQGETNLVNEPGLYGVIMQSRKPEAKAFKRWIKHDILPEIRKTGGYGKPQMPSVITADYLQEVVNHMRLLEEKVEEQTALIAAQDQQIEEMNPKVSYYDLVLQSEDLVKTSEIATDYGMTAPAFNNLLHEMGIQYRQGKIWLLYSKYNSYGYTKTKTFNYTKKNGNQGHKIWMYWTQKGRLWLYDLLKAEGILPVIEQEAEVS